MKKLTIFSQFFKGYGPVYLLGVLILITINILFLYVPRLIGEAINTLYYGKEGLTTYIGYFFMLAIVVTVLKFSSRHLLLGSIRRFEFLLRRRLFDHALYIPTAYYEKNGPGKVMALMTNDVTSLRVSLGLGVMILVDAIFFGIFSFFLMAKEISVSLTALTLLPMPFILTGMLTVSRRMRKRQKEAQNTYSDLTEFAQELFLGMPVIRAFNREMRSLWRFNNINKVNYDKNMRVAFLDSILAPLTFVAPFMCHAIAIFICGRLIIANEITVGDFVAVNGYLNLIIGPIMGIGSLLSVLQKGLASLDRIYDFLMIEEEKPTDEERELPLTTITVKDLTFTYPETKVPMLHDVNLTIKPGEFIGIVGGPGSGKSTLFKLLLRLHDTPQGSIYVGDEDITTMPLQVLRRSIAYVPPEPYLLGTTIGENIAFGEASNHTLELTQAAERAALTRDLSQRLAPAAKRLKEGGTDLSGGQKQRVNIARGLYKNAPYLLLDDSFSALDTISAGTIINTLRQGRNQNLLFISQRLEALREADRIIVFKEGTIVEEGTHEALMAKEGEYYRLYAQQLDEPLIGVAEEGGDQ
ncbi:MAG: ABC transporter ATP-binding protein [Veillonella sp.]|uniref:ABC transporter ATP-binding protein n=1 Tax=Veillonella sp. TaxID=1926307 RepID=UPI0025DFFEBC|nr:ABC transporter ATP-binding protein [Veillonella sp.]MBE6080751.1 ABC transporter ATP-binding protein [Veillonella sp.]